MNSRSLIFGSSAYANALPLSRFLRDVCPESQLLQDVPSALPAKLCGGEIDAALIPVAALLTQSGLEMIPAVGVCSKAEVWSVLIKLWRPLPEVRRVGSDPASRTSNALAKIILRRRHGIPAEVLPPAAGERMDAEVTIGDRALCDPPAPHGALDMGAEWNAMTGLPFVFAVWACRAGDPRKDELGRIARLARDRGIEALPRLAESEAERLGLPVAVCREYFTCCIHYRVGPPELKAMRLFGEWIREGETLSSRRAEGRVRSPRGAQTGRSIKCG